MTEVDDFRKTINQASIEAIFQFAMHTGTQREFMARVHAKLLERLSAGEIIHAPAVDRHAKNDPLDYSR